jgi:hypothetical protein
MSVPITWAKSADKIWSMVQRLAWGPETDWQHPMLCSTGAIPLYVRAAGNVVTGLRHRRVGAWRTVDIWNDPRAWEPGTLIYLSGPMSGHPDNNVPMFEEHSKRLRDQGFRVLSPPELARQLGITPEAPDANDRYEQVLAHDLQAVDRAQLVLLLGPAPWTSRGVRLELRRAYTRGRPVMHAI